jgi:alkylation response protein AidB-like acyl-CoA dehydrogenase
MEALAREEIGELDPGAPAFRRTIALEYKISRILCDARSIFEGAAEIQAQVIARRLLDGRN